MLNWINKKRNKKGFTLVELVVVIAILGILAAIAVPKLNKSRESASIVAHNANVRTLESAATLAVSEGSGAITWEGKATDSTPANAWENYLQEWPKVPSGLIGKNLISDTKDEAPVKISDTTVYKVEIDANGVITVTPTKIK